MSQALAKQTILSITRTKKLLKHNFKQFEAYGPGKYLPLSLWGHSGIGKTSIVNQTATELAASMSKERGRPVRIMVRSFQMSAMQPFDLSGYPMIDDIVVDNAKGRKEYKVQKFATPEFLIEAEIADEDTYTILFFDEWNRARTEMHNAFMGYIDGRGVNGHTIPNNIFCVAAANPSTDAGDYGAITDVDDQAILDRLIHINVVPTDSEFTDFLYADKNAHPAVQAFLEEDKSRLPKNGFDGITGETRTTNRGLVDVARALNFLTQEKSAIDRKVIIEAVAKGVLGNQAGALFIERFGQCEFLTTPEALILKGSSEAFGKIKVAVGRDSKGENRLDQVAKVSDNVVRFLNADNRAELTKTHAKRLNKFLDLIPHDMKANLLKKSKFTETEANEFGFKKKTVEVLEVTSSTSSKKLDPWR